MECPHSETCTIHEQHGDSLCAALFCKDKCPPRDPAPYPANMSKKGLPDAKILPKK